MIRDLSQLSFSGKVTLHSGNTRVELIARNGQLEIHIPPGQGIKSLLSLRRKTPTSVCLLIPSFLTGSIPVFIFNRPLLTVSLNSHHGKKVSWNLTPLKFFKEKHS